MLLPTPETLSQFQRTLWEAEGIVLNVLLFGRFVRHEIEALFRRRRKRTGGIE
jgi:hypothetical protein